jgi:hypothetical protein
VQTDSRGCAICIEKASEGLEARYRGGTGYAIDAAMHSSSNLIFVAAVDKKLCRFVDAYTLSTNATLPFRRALVTL